jgi:MYND finger
MCFFLRIFHPQRLGVIKCYCYQDLNNGIRMLEAASRGGYVRAKYTLGIILRDAMPEKGTKYMKDAADAGYFPALQETLSAREMKERFGDYTADELRQYLDPVGLNRLLVRDYVNSAELRGMNTSHCWNPLCGKWAFKANTHNSNSPTNRRNQGAGPTYDVVSDETVMDPPPIDYGYGPVSRANTGRSSSAFARTANRYGGSNISTIGGSPLQQMQASRHHNTMASVPCNHTHPSESNQALAWKCGRKTVDCVSRMKMCSRCCRAKYCSKLCQVYDWRSNQHKMECQFL